MDIKGNGANPTRPSASLKAGDALPSKFEDTLLTPAQTAQLLKISPRTLEKYRAAGNHIPWTRPTQRSVRYRLSDVMAYVARRTVHSTSEPDGGGA